MAKGEGGLTEAGRADPSRDRDRDRNRNPDPSPKPDPKPKPKPKPNQVGARGSAEAKDRVRPQTAGGDDP